MSKVVGIFAHPDDEAFGPGGTLAQCAKTSDVYIICATSGDIAGKPDIRQKELLSSAKILGIKKFIFLIIKMGAFVIVSIMSLRKISEKFLTIFNPSNSSLLR